MTQSARLDALEKFRSNAFAYLVATDVAGRGLDIVGVEVVINYDAPPSLDTYLHRIGRTARAGAEGLAVTFVTDTNRALLKQVMEATKQRLMNRIIPAEAIAYYEQQLQLHQRHLKLVEKEEAETEKLDRAEMEIERTKNRIAHETEIMAKPARTWFQTKQQRKEIKKLAKREDEGLPDTDDAFDMEGRTTKKKSKARKGEVKAQPEMAETKTVKGTIRAIKNHQRLLESQGMDSKSATKRARAFVLPMKGHKKRPRDSDEDEGFLKDPSKIRRKKKSKAPVSEFFEEGRHPSRVYAGGAKSGHVTAKAISKKKINLIKRGGKGKHAFKGKRKFKRR